MSRRTLLTMRWVTILVLAGLLGCAGTPDAPVDPLGAAPADFTVDVLIRCGPDAAERPEVHRRPGRLVLFPDGSLHFASGADVDVEDLPPKVRTVSRRDLAEVWSFVQQSGLGDGSAAVEPLNFDLVRPPESGLVYLIGFRGDRERWAYLRASNEMQPPDPAAVLLIRRLAELAWASDIAEEEVAIIPRRYDLGPDPYERYREP
jgi:hypothetical protein